jgi:hypothetical protein
MIIGYSAYDKQIQDSYSKSEKPKRTPNITKTTNPLIGRVVDVQTSKLQSKARLPTHPAIQQAQTYRAMMDG